MTGSGGVFLIAFLVMTPQGRVAAQQRPGGQPTAVNGIADSARAQIDALLRDKAARTPVEQKIDSQLIFEQRKALGRAIVSGVQTLETGIEYEGDGRLTLDVSADVNDALLDQIRALRVEIVSAEPKYHALRVRAGIGQIEEIAALPEVRFVGPKQEAIAVDRAEFIRVRNAQKTLARAALIAQVKGALASHQDAITSAGSKNSEGDLTHKAAFARSTYNVSGNGVKVGILSNGVSNLAASQALGDLPAVTVVPGQGGFGDRGTAMLEIVHDLAPDAQLYFATAFNGITNFAHNIRTLRNTYGCDIIVDDAFYPVESPFQDGQGPAVLSQYNAGVIIQAVKDVTAAGALYFSAAGNGGNLNDGTSGTWEGNFVDGGVAGAPISGVESARLHNFAAGQPYDVVTVATSPISLYWSDPLGNSANDYDLFILNSAGTTILASALNIQNGSGKDPYETIATNGGGGIPSGSRIVIVKNTGGGTTPADRFLHLSVYRGRLGTATAGEIRGHAATNSPNAFGVAATPARPPAGPSPGPFTGANTVEPDSSDGPRRIFYNFDGTAITPDNFLATGGLVLNKPDITAADGVLVTGVGNFPSAGCAPTCVFYGTGAAAAHAGAIAALVKSKNLALPAAQVSAALLGSAIDIEAFGLDRDSGRGIVMADTAVEAVSVPPAIAFIAVNRAFPVAPGTTITWIAVATGGTAPLQYQFYRRNMNTGVWTLARPWSTSRTFIWATTPADQGTYLLQAQVRGAGATGDAEAFLNTAPFGVDGTFPVNVVSLTANRTFPVAAGTSITWSAEASGGSAVLQYQFYRYDLTTETWSLVQPYSSSNAYTSTPGPAQAGPQLIQVWVRSSGSSAAFEAFANSPLFAITTNTLTVSVVSIGGSLQTGSELTFTARARGGVQPTSYRFYLFNTATSTWTLLRGWATSPSLSWTFRSPGTFLVQAQGRNPGSTDADSSLNTETFTVTAGPVAVTSLTADRGFPSAVGTVIGWTATATGGNAPLLYKFWRYSVGAGTWTMVQDYSPSGFYSWNTTGAPQGTYLIQVWVKGTASSADVEGSLNSPYFGIDNTFPVEALPIESSISQPMPGVEAGTAFGGKARGGNVPLEYRWWYYDGTWVSLSSYSLDPGTVIISRPPGFSYQMQLWVRRTGSSADWEAFSSTGPIVVREPTVTTRLTGNYSGALPAGTPLTVRASSTPDDAYHYKFYRHSSVTSSWTLVQDWSATETYSQTLPSAPGNYIIQVYTRRAGSLADEAIAFENFYYTITP